MQHHWKARLGVGIAMLALAFLGVLLTFFLTNGGWEYWTWIAPVYAILVLGLSWYIRREKEIAHPIWHEMLHWLGLFIAVLLIILYVHLGIVSKNMGALFVLTLLAFSVFIAGVYVEKTFLLIGAVLALFALMVAYTAKLMLALVLVILVLAAVGIGYMVWHSHKKGQI